MKTAKLYFTYASFHWNCFTCGHFNTVHFNKDGLTTNATFTSKKKITSEKVIIPCGCCGKKRKLVVNFELHFPNNPDRDKKLKKLQKKFAKEHKFWVKGKGNRYFPPDKPEESEKKKKSKKKKHRTLFDKE